MDASIGQEVLRIMGGEKEERIRNCKRTTEAKGKLCVEGTE